MDIASQNDDRKRPYLPPRRAVNFCSAGFAGTLLMAPLVLVLDVLYFLFGDNGLNVFMPDGLPVGPLILSIAFAIFGVTYVRKVYVYGTVKWIRRFRRVATLSSLFVWLLLLWNVWQLIRAPNQDVFASYLIFVGMLGVALGLSGLMLWTINRYRWYDPNSTPDEWELPEAIAQQDKPGG